MAGAETSTDSSWGCSTCCNRPLAISKRLLPIKLFYFFYCGGIASLGPFIPVFLIQVAHLTPLHLAIIFGTTPFITLFAKPIFGIIADKMKKIKVLLPACVSTLTFAYVSFCFIPLIYPNNAINPPWSSQSLTLYCHQQTALFISECVADAESCIPKSTSNVPEIISCLIHTIQPVNNTNSSINGEIPLRITDRQCTHNSSDAMSPCSNVSVDLPYQVYLLKSESGKRNEQPNEFYNTFKEFHKEKLHFEGYKLRKSWSVKENLSISVSQAMELESQNAESQVDVEFDSGDSKDIRSCKYFNIVHDNATNFMGMASHVKSCGGEVPAQPVLYNIHVTCAGDTNVCPGQTAETNHSRKMESDDIEFGSMFWCVYFVYLVARLFIGVIYALSDALTLDVLGGRSRNYGKQRLWGTVGWGVCSLVAGLAMHSGGSSTDPTNSVQPGTVNFDAAFWLFGSLMFVCFLISLFLNPIHGLEIPNFKAGLMLLAHQAEMLVFIVSVFLFGMLFSLYVIYYVLYLHQMGASTTLAGLVLLMDAVSEVPTFLLSGFIIHKLGYIASTSLGFTSWGVRLVGVSYLTDPWWCLPLEGLHGICFALMYTSMVSYGKVHTPPGMSATIQALIGAVFDVGIGGGSLVCGIMLDSYGSSLTFRIMGLSALSIAVLYGLIQTLLAKYHRRQLVNSAASREKTLEQHPQHKHDGINDPAAEMELLEKNGECMLRLDNEQLSPVV